jgi:hypothetical protein
LTASLPVEQEEFQIGVGVARGRVSLAHTLVDILARSAAARR